MVERRLPEHPFFSVCIPQHNRTSFLIEVCRSLSAQEFQSLEVCISDDCSTDGREGELLAWLQASSLGFVYRRLERNGRYDVNLRSAIDLAQGEYCFLLGNDDVLRDQHTLGDLHAAIQALPAQPAVVFTNFEDYRSGAVTRRVRQTGLVGSGPAIAAGSFRKFSFVSGVLLHTAPAKLAATPAWDGSEMYQMYIGCRLMAAGGSLFESDLVTIRKDLQLPGEAVDSYARRGPLKLEGIPEQPIPLVQLAGLVIDAIEPHLPPRRFHAVVTVLVQFYGFLYPFWILEYRRVQSWRYAAGVARAMRPRRTLARVSLSGLERLTASVAYVLATVAGFLIPLGLLNGVLGPARRAATWVGDRAVLSVSPVDRRVP